MADVESQRFRGANATPLETISSSVTVWPNATAAERNALAEKSARGRTCTLHVLERATIAATARVRISHISLASLPAPLPEAKDSHAVRAYLTIAAEASTQAGPSSAALEPRSARRVQVPVVIDALGFVSGPAEVSLTAMSLKRPASSATEHRLLSLLYSRAKADKL